MNLNQILISFILILLLIIWYYIRKEHFDVSDGDAKCVDEGISYQGNYNINYCNLVLKLTS